MHPILFEIGSLTARTYGALIALAFLAAIGLVRHAARLRHLSEAFILDLAVVVVFAGLFGARVFYVAISWSYYAQHPLEIVKIWEGGLVFYGGFIAAALAAVVYARRHRMRLGATADCIAPGLALGQAIGRLGCFFAGCCYGRPTHLPWAVRFTDPASLAPLGVDLHPVQLYEAAGNFLIAAILWVRFRQQPHSKGQIFWLYVLFYGLLRLVMEMLRGDDRGPTLGGLYPSQCIAIVAVLVSLAILLSHESRRDGHV